MKKLFIISIILVALFFLCALIPTRAQSAAPALQAAKIQAKDTGAKHPAQETEAEQTEHSHTDKGGAHISGEHEKFELFHAEYYSMPWRSVRTQKDLWILIEYVAGVNILLLLLITVKMRRKYKP